MAKITVLGVQSRDFDGYGVYAVRTVEGTFTLINDPDGNDTVVSPTGNISNWNELDEVHAELFHHVGEHCNGLAEMQNIDDRMLNNAR